MKRAKGQHLKQPAWPGRQLSQELRLQTDMQEGPEADTWHRMGAGEEKGPGGKAPGDLKSQNEPCSQKREKESHGEQKEIFKLQEMGQYSLRNEHMNQVQTTSRLLFWHCLLYNAFVSEGE